MTKTIQLNPQFLSTSSTRNSDKGTRKLRDKKEKPAPLVQPNKMRNDLLKKIKDYQAKTEGKDINTENKKDKNMENVNLQDFTDEFNKSLHFLQDLTNRKDNMYKPSKTRKNPKSFEVDIELPDEMKTETAAAFAPTSHAPATTFAPATIFKPSIYSSMKNGSKPTYREIHNNNKPFITIEDKQPIIESDAHKMLEKIKSDYKKANVVGANVVACAAANEVGTNACEVANEEEKSLVGLSSEISLPVKRKIKRTTRTCKYRLGKLGNKVSVLIKDYKTRKHIQNECYKLEKTNITDVKNFLRKKNLLKVGSVADEAVLREMYEQCILAGDIQNSNKDTLIHNFLTKV